MAAAETVRLTMEEARRILEAMGEVFDLVRFVDPVDRVVLIPADGGWRRGEGDACYRVWNKSLRCQNCVSLRARNAQKRMTKYEFIGETVYNAVSRPVVLLGVDGQDMECCLEMVCEITDEVFFDAFEKGEIISRIIESELWVYTDSLTGVYNRRFYDERAFCHRRGFDIGPRAAFVMADFKGFKSINDCYGHEAGDFTLRKAAGVMRGCVREQDAVIRLGGDEFLIVLADCGAEGAQDVVKRINAAFSGADLRPDGEPLACNFGISATDEFREDKTFIDRMLALADRDMYADKREM